MSDLMSAEALSIIDTEISVAPSEYISPFTRDVYRQAAFTAGCATQLIPTPGKNYRQALSLVPPGHRISVLDEIEYLIQREAELRAGGRNPRGVLQDSLFERQIKGKPYLWMHSHVALRAPKGKKFRDYIEDHEGRPYTRGDYVVGEKTVAEGVPIPVSLGGKVVAWNRPLRIPAVVSEGNEPEHTTHWYLNTDEDEVAVQLFGGFWHYAERGRCLGLGARFGRSGAVSAASFRLFRGSLDEVTLPSVEYKGS